MAILMEMRNQCGFIYHHTNRDIHWKLMDDIRTEHVTCMSREDAELLVQERKNSLRE